MNERSANQWYLPKNLLLRLASLEPLALVVTVDSGVVTVDGSGVVTVGVVTVEGVGVELDEDEDEDEDEEDLEILTLMDGVVSTGSGGNCWTQTPSTSMAPWVHSHFPCRLTKLDGQTQTSLPSLSFPSSNPWLHSQAQVCWLKNWLSRVQASAGLTHIKVAASLTKPSLQRHLLPWRVALSPQTMASQTWLAFKANPSAQTQESLSLEGTWLSGHSLVQTPSAPLM